MATLRSHQIKINRAVKMARIGAYPNSASAMINHIPDTVISALPARLIAAQIDALWDACQASKAIADREAIQNGFVWDSPRNLAVELRTNA